MRQPPPPLIRLSTGAGAVVGGPAAAARDDSRDERQQAPWVVQYTPSVQTSSVPPVTPHCSPQSNNTTPSPQSEPAAAVTIATLDPSFPYTPRQIKSIVVTVAATTGDNTIITAATTASIFPSPGAPLFASVVNNMMFRMGTKSRSPRRAASSSSSSALSTISAPTSAPSIITSKPGSPTRSYSASIVVPDPLQRPFSPWGSSDSQSSTSPRNSTRMSRGTFINKRSGSPTASVGTSNTSTMASRSKSFLGRNRKQQQQQQQADTEFDPTTFRKNRTRPARKGQDALYGEYEDLFDDSLDEDLNEDSLPSDGGGDTDEDGYLMLRRKNGNGGGSGGGGCGGGESPVSPPRSRVTPRSVPMQDDMRYNGSLSPPPPAPPPKNWTQKRSLVVVTTPPRSAPASVDEPLTISVTSLPSAPPTPPPKPILFALDTKNLTITTIHNSNSNNSNHNYNTITPSSSLSSARESEETNGTSPASSNPPPHRPPPDAPISAAAVEKNRSKRLSRQFLEQAEKNDGLGIIRIPSPTLFHSLFTPSASSSSWSELPGHATRSPALTHSPSSYTPRQPPPPTTAYETLPSDDDFIPTGILFDETPDGLGVLPLFSSRSENFSPRHHSNNNHQHYSNNPDSYFPPQTPQMTQVILNELPPESPGDVSASTSKSIETLMDTYMETTDTYKEVQIRVAEDDKDAKEVILQSLAPEVVPTPAEEKILLLDEQQDDAAKDSSYLRAFRTFVKSSGENDSFVHRMPRFDALQAQRICSHLRQDYPLIAGGSKRRSAGGKTAGGNVPAKQREVGEEILTSLWALMALRWMNFGRVIISPGHETLLAASAKRLTRRATVKMDQRATQMLENVVVEGSVPDHERRRVLDLGGLPIADWGWHCAYDYPKAKVYTVTTRTHGKSSAEDPESQDTPLSADKYRGPKNHRHLVVSNLWKLPFPSNHFDVVSARTLYLNLKTTVPSRLQNDQNMDEYDLCLEECLRVLKPGGHLEFTLFDNDIINPGPLGSELSEKFGKSLQAKGYDPEPTKKWISRLNRAGYGEIKRSWMFLPMAPPCSKPKVPSKGENLPAHESQDLDLAKEEVRKKIEAWEEGNTKKGSLENASPITGLVGSWIWEKWMLKTSNESGEGEWSLAADTVGSVLNEAKERGSGWRTLVGWARKPLHVGQH